MGMGDFLFKKFIKDHENVKDVKVRDSYGKMAGIVGIISNGLLCAMKIVIGLISGSIAIVADGINNLADASSSVITLAGFRLASMPEDEEHPYGHARMEYLAGTAVSIVIILVGVELGKNSLEKNSRSHSLRFQSRSSHSTSHRHRRKDMAGAFQYQRRKKDKQPRSHSYRH